MIKICHLSTVHSADDVRIFEKECKSLAANNFDVTLIVTGDITRDDTIFNVKRIQISVPVRNRLQRILKRTKVLYKKALLVNADVYHFHDPELIPVGLKLKKRKKIVIYDVHEDYPLNILTKNWLPFFLRHSVAKLMSYYERRVAGNFDAIITVTPQIVNRFNKKNKNTVLITNYPILNITTDSNEKNKDGSSFCYAGTISSLRMIHSILRAMEAFPALKFFLAGQSEDKYIARLEKMPGWKNVVFLGEIPYNEVISLYSNVMFGIVIENYHPINYKNEGSIGVTKLFEYMQAGLPVICTDFILHKEIIDTYRCGITVNPTDIREITEAMEYMLKNPSEAKKMGERGKKAVIQYYNWSTQERSLIVLYNKLIAESSVHNKN
jgi:glycosyltransferase involved in cell wall biosynthesis